MRTVKIIGALLSIAAAVLAAAFVSFAVGVILTYKSYEPQIKAAAAKPCDPKYISCDPSAGEPLAPTDKTSIDLSSADARKLTPVILEQAAGAALRARDKKGKGWSYGALALMGYHWVGKQEVKGPYDGEPLTNFRFIAGYDGHLHIYKNNTPLDEIGDDLRELAKSVPDPGVGLPPDDEDVSEIVWGLDAKQLKAPTAPYMEIGR